jgi:L-ascorbate metabolism protein UlaG (beta-lactamase superfamily)
MRRRDSSNAPPLREAGGMMGLAPYGDDEGRDSLAAGAPEERSDHAESPRRASSAILFAMPHARIWLGLIAALLFAIGFGATRQDSKPTEGGVSVQYLANEGFLLRAPEHSVLIDAFVGEPHHPYAAVPAELLKKLTAAKAPFDAIDLALTSHVHRDHFQADVACAYLAADVEVPLWSAEQVIEAVRKHCEKLPGGPERLRPFWCESGKALTAEHGGLKIEFFPLFHVKDIQNLAHLIHFRDCLVLHVGDAVLDEKEYAPYALAKRKIDVALLPYWYFLDQSDCTSVKQWIDAKHYVAMHVPPKEFAEVRRTLAANMPGITLLEKGGDAVQIGVKK